MTFLQQLRCANVQRNREIWPDECGVWGPKDWFTAMVGEVGELGQALRDGILIGEIPDGRTIKALKDEIADVIIYADLLAYCLGIDLDDAIVQKFNATSRKVGSTVELKP